MSRTNSIIQRLPHFYRSEDRLNLLYHFVGLFGASMNDAEEDLIRVMRSHWVNAADNILPQGEGSGAKGDLDKIFSLYLESLGGTALLRQGNRREGEAGLLDDEVYRKRILGLIKVLREGASTKAGIQKIVGANFGIVEGDFGADKALAQIQIVEYLPEVQKLELDTLGGQTSVDLSLFEAIDIQNPNALATQPSIRIEVIPDFPLPIIQPSLVNITTGERITYQGTLLNGQGGDPDVLEFFADGTATLNAEAVAVSGEMPLLPIGTSTWRFEAKVGLAEGRYDQAVFDFAKFEEETTDTIGQFDITNFDASIYQILNKSIRMEMELRRLYPATFMLKVPWDIPGFTVTIRVTDAILQQLQLQGYAVDLIDRLQPIVGQEFRELKAFYEGLETTLGEDLPEQLFDDLLPLVSFEDQFKAMSINPRAQISTIVDRVRAAGVYALVTYEKRFVEPHFVEVNLAMNGQLDTEEYLIEEQEMIESNFDVESRQSNSSDQDMSDHLHLSGIYDITRFDTSLNGFA
ncbi:MAG: hypothetical protein AAFP19_05430 [Bacteroidota bacterium]